MISLYSRLTERKIWILLVAVVLVAAALWVAGIATPGLMVGLAIGTGLVAIWRLLGREGDDSSSSSVGGP